MPKSKRWAASEHSRIVSGVFAKSIRGGDEEREGVIVQNATFGLARLRLQSMHNFGLAKSTSRRDILRPNNKTQPATQQEHNREGSVADKHDDKRSATGVITASKLKRRYDLGQGVRAAVKSEFLWQLAEFLDSIYVMISVPLRIGFFFDPWNEPSRRISWTFALTLFSILDVSSSLLRITIARKPLKSLVRNSLFLGCMRVIERSSRESSVFRAIRASVIGEDVSIRSARSTFSARGDRIAPFDAVPIHRNAKSRHHQSLHATWLEMVTKVMYVVPWEVACVLLNYNWMHIIGVARFPHAVYNLPKQFHAVFFTHFRETKLVQVLSFSTIAITVYLVFVGMYLCHLAASGYIFVAHWRCGLKFTHCKKFPLPQAWVLRDNLERGSMVRKYARTLYWACKTVTTLGQGDLVPATNAETLYRVVVQFISGLWATAVLTAYSFFFSHKDANMTTNICTRRQQAAQYLLARKLPAELAANVRIYFQYMERTRNGVEEELILSELPPHYRTQCSHYVKFKCFRRITIFKNRQGAFLRTVLNLLEKDFFTPNQVVLEFQQPEDMLIVAAGEIRITDDKAAIKGRLTQGNAYAEYALFEDHSSNNRLVAETYCELWYLTRRAFKVALRRHFSKLIYASILAKKLGVSKHSNIPVAGSNTDQVARLNSFEDMESSARMLKLLGNGSAVKNKMVQKISRDATSAAKKIPAWRQPNSLFRFLWRGFGLLNGDEQPIFGAVPFIVQLSDFFLSIGIELFFYCDLYFRARCFVRPALSHLERKEEEDHNNVNAVAMISDKSQIFRHYLENENYWLDVFVNLPISLAWDVLPKQWFTPRTTQFIRFFRVIRLLRACKLKKMLKTLMLEHGFATYIRLLAYIVVYVVSAAHCAGCLFFLVADIDIFYGGLPAEGVVPGIISTPRCLEDASLYGNCTWYMYDRSTFNIDASYLRSLHWSLVLLSTVGYGDIVSFTTKECIAACIWIFCGANICYFTGSALSSVVAQVNILDTIHHERVEEINLVLMSATTVAEKTKSMLRSYYETKWKFNGSAVHDEEVMLHLPRSLRRQVMLALFMEDISKCPLFVDVSPDYPMLVQQLAQCARCEIFLRNSFVIREGHLATEFFLIPSGDAEKLLPVLKSTAVDLSKLRAPRETNTFLEKYNRLSVKLSPASMSVDITTSKLASPFTLVEQSSHGVFKKASSSPKLASIKANAAADAQGSASNASSSPVHRSIGSCATLPVPQIGGNTVPVRSAAPVGGRQTLWRIGTKAALPTPERTVFVSVLKKDDYFGEESLAPRARNEVYQISVRVLSTIQVAVIRRQNFLTLSVRFPQQFQNILARRKQQVKADDLMLKKLRVNFFFKDKLRKRLGSTDSLNLEGKQLRHDKKRVWTLDPEKPLAKWWHRIIGSILVYNFYVIIFRISFLPYPSESLMFWLTAWDYLCDVLLFADIYLKHQHIGYIEYGQKVLDPIAIRKRYRKGWFAQDCWSMLPIYYQGDYFYMTAARVVRLLRSPQLVTLLDEVHTEIQQNFLKGNTVLSNVFDLVKFVLIFVSTAHYIGSLYYLLGRLQLETGLVKKSWVSSDFILDQYPNDPLVHYMRAMYWCLSTFTVDCFGDIWAHNFLESCFAGFTCVLGWIFVGQVIGRINSLMVTINMEAKQRHERAEDFEQYAKQRKLSYSLRQRAMQSLAYKSECLLELNAGDVFRDLPTALRCQLFYEMYGSFLKSTPLFQKLTRPQLEAIANVLCVDIYSALESGVIFGEFGFFIPSATRLASARAVRSCQILQLDKKKWNCIWPREVREEIESHLVPMVKAKYIQTSKTYMNISKNLFTKNEKAATPASATRVPVAKPVVKRLSKVHPAPLSPGHRDNASAEAGTTSPKVSTTLSAQNVKPTQRRSLSIEPGATIKSFRSLSPSTRRKTVLERTNSKLNQLNNKLEGHQTSANGKDAGAPEIQELTSPSEPALTIASSVPVPQRSVALKQEEQKQERDKSAAKRNPAPMLDRRRSSASLIKRRSSIPTLTDVFGMKNAAEFNQEGPEILDTQGKPAAGKAQEKNGSEEEERDCFVKTPSLVTPTGVSPLLTKEDNVQEVMGLSLASETKWRRHQKRLQGIMTFYAGSLKVLVAVNYDSEAQAARRHSISVVPTYFDDSLSEEVQNAWQGFNSYFPVRRHSILGDEKEMSAKLLAINDFENKLTVEVVIPPPPVQIPSPTPNLEKRRVMPFAGSANDATANSSQAAMSSKYQIWAQPSSASPMFLENSAFRHFWNILMLTITLYYLVIIPFRIGFLQQFLSDAANVFTVEIWFSFEYLLADSFCVVDFILKRGYFVYLDHGEVVSDAKELAAHYWYRGSFVVDALSILPLKLLAVIGVYATTTAAAAELTHSMHPPQELWHALSLLRVNRFLRGVHLHSLSDKVQRFLLYELKIGFIRPSVFYLLRLALDFALGTHWVACLFYGISFLTFDEARPSWLTAPGMLLFEGCKNFYEVAHVPVLVAYLRSFHFSIGAITTVCYGDILPLNAIENVVTLAVIFISVAFFSMLSGGFFKFFEHELGKRAEYEEKVAQVGHFMVFRQFPARTWKQMQVYFALSWQESKGMHEDQMLRGLTTMVRQEIALHVHANLMKHVKLFTHTDEQFARVVVGALKHELFVRNDVVIQRGDMGRSLYIIETGLVSICVVRNLYRRASTAESTADATKTHRTSVTEWMNPSVMPLADAQRVAAAGAMAGGLPGGGGGGGVAGDGGITGASLEPVRDLSSALRGRGRKVTQREEKFVKGPFDYFGERSLLFGTPRNATCTALCVCSLFVLTIDKFEAILDEFPCYRGQCVKIWVMNKNLPAAK